MKKRSTKKTPQKAQTVAVLTCEDASHLGGPMGTEYTTPMWEKVFGSVEAAKQFAYDDAKKYVDDKWNKEWTKHSTGHLGWDARCVIYGIDVQEVRN